MPGDLTQYLKGEIFVKKNGRYRYTQGKNADVIVLSRDGLAYGRVDVEAKVKPNQADRKAYPRVKIRIPRQQILRLPESSFVVDVGDLQDSLRV